MTKPYQISRSSASYSSSALEFVCKEFPGGSSLHLARGITSAEYQEHLQEDWSSYIESGLSAVVVDKTSSRLVACMLAKPYVVEPAPRIVDNEKFAPISALLEALRARYRESEHYKSSKKLLIDIAVVDPLARGKGLYSSLRRHCQEAGRQAGFTTVIGELSSKATQTFCVNNQRHLIRAELVFSKFEYENNYPFAMIENPRSIQLVEGEL